MAITNTTENYGSVAKYIHWIIALLFLCSYLTVYYRHWFTDKDTPENWLSLQLHLSIGISILALVLLRIIWRISNTTPSPEPGSPLAHKAAKLGHYALYAIMIISPVTGYIGTGVQTEYFFLFDIAKFEDTQLFNSVIQNGLGMTFKEFEEPIDKIHKEFLGEYLVWLLILGHTLAALYHHIVKQDRTIKKMTSGRP